MPLDPTVLESPEFKEALNDAITQATSPLQQSIENLQSTNAALKSEKQAVAGQLNEFKSKFEGIDVEAMQERLKAVDNDETRALLAQGEFDAVYEKKFAQIDADHAAQLKAASKTAEDATIRAQVLEDTLVSTVRDGGISQAFVSTEADKTQLRAARAIAKDTVMHKGELVPVVSVGTDGVPTFRHSETGEVLQNADGNFGFNDWLKHLAEAEGLPLFAKPNGHGSTKAMNDGNPKGYVKSKMNQAEKQKFKSEHGIAAYDNLPYS